MNIDSWINDNILTQLTDKDRGKKIHRTIDIFTDFLIRDFTTVEPQIIVSGSYGRKTDLPDSDVDIFLILDADKYSADIQLARKEVFTIIQKNYPKNSYRLQDHTIGITVQKIRLEVIPAFKHLTSFIIPEGEGELTTDPLLIKKLVFDLNKKNFGKLSQIVRLSKYWKKQNNLKLKSFYIECLAMEYFKKINISSKKNIKDLFLAFFQFMNSSILENHIPEHYMGEGLLSFLNESEQYHLENIFIECTDLVLKLAKKLGFLRTFFV